MWFCSEKLLQINYYLKLLFLGLLAIYCKTMGLGNITEVPERNQKSDKTTVVHLLTLQFFTYIKFRQKCRSERLMTLAFNHVTVKKYAIGVFRVNMNDNPVGFIIYGLIFQLSFLGLNVAQNGQRRKTTWEDVIICFLRADLSWRTQEEASWRAGCLCRVFKKMCGKMEGELLSYLSKCHVHLGRSCEINLLCTINWLRYFNRLKKWF